MNLDKSFLDVFESLVELTLDISSVKRAKQIIDKRYDYLTRLHIWDKVKWEVDGIPFKGTVIEINKKSVLVEREDRKREYLRPEVLTKVAQ